MLRLDGCIFCVVNVVLFSCGEQCEDGLFESHTGHGLLGHICFMPCAFLDSDLPLALVNPFYVVTEMHELLHHRFDYE